MMKAIINEGKRFRREILDMAMKTGNGHIASAFSCIDIIYILYKYVMQKDDVFILSKGHASMALYVVLKDLGFNPNLNHHLDIQQNEGVFCTTGSLGHGYSIGAGVAFSKKLLNQEGLVYVLVGDGECQEGTIWETADIAFNLGLDNLIIIVDNNHQQALKFIYYPDNLSSKFSSFGLETIELNGHDINAIFNSCIFEVNSKPKVLIANTIKGNGVSFMEKKLEYHNKIPDEKMLIQAYEELK